MVTEYGLTELRNEARKLARLDGRRLKLKGVQVVKVFLAVHPGGASLRVAYLDSEGFARTTSEAL